MKVSIKEFTEELNGYILKHQDMIRQLKAQPVTQLQRKAAPDRWNALECIAHLNAYGDYYIPEIGKRIAESKTSPVGHFKPGMIGNYFAKIMLPQTGKKMKAMSSYNFIDHSLTIEELSKLEDQLNELKKLVAKAAEVNLNRVKCSISLTRLIKLKLGDTLRVVIYHNERHLLQALRAINNG